jgi:hypothetical protein
VLLDETSARPDKSYDRYLKAVDEALVNAIYEDEIREDHRVTTTFEGCNMRRTLGSSAFSAA